MSALKAIHTKRRLAHSLKEDETWRDFVERHTGQRSTRGLTQNQSKALLSALDELTGGKTPKRRKQLSGPYAPKIQALWISCWNLGLISSRDDAALNRFAVKQAKVDHTNWIRDQEDAVAVIEALKKMLERRGVCWANERGAPPFMSKPGFKIAVAQWMLIHNEPKYCETGLADHVLHLTGLALPDVSDDDWILVMNAFGEAIRDLVSKGDA